MKTLPEILKEIEEEGKKNVSKADRLLDAILLMEKAFNKAIETLKTVKDELKRKPDAFDQLEDEHELEKREPK